MFSNKKILFFGAGAVGSFYGGILASQGFNVTFVARGPHYETLQTEKLQINSTVYGKIDIKVNAIEMPDNIYDIVFICVKAHDTETACKILKNHVHKNTIFVSFQNGIENHEIISDYFGVNNVVPASIFIGVSILKPGVVNHKAHGKVTLGYLNEKSKQNAEQIFEILSSAGIETYLTDEIKTVLWKKLIWNATFNPLSVIFETTCGRLVNNPETLSVMKNIINECITTALAEKIKIPDDYKENILIVDESLKDYKTSMLVDIQNKKKPEIDGILGAVVRKAEKNNIKVPVCNTLYKIITAKYGGNFIYTPKLTVDIIVYRNNELLLIERKNPPFGWALPGGFVDYGEKTENAAKRELFEETSIKVRNLELLGVYSDPARDNRMHTVSTVYYVRSDKYPKAGDDAKKAVFYKFDELPKNIVFDHRQIINDFLNKVIENKK